MGLLNRAMLYAMTATATADLTPATKDVSPAFPAKVINSSVYTASDAGYKGYSKPAESAAKNVLEFSKPEKNLQPDAFSYEPKEYEYKLGKYLETFSFDKDGNLQEHPSVEKVKAKLDKASDVQHRFMNSFLRRGHARLENLSISDEEINKMMEKAAAEEALNAEISGSNMAIQALLEKPDFFKGLTTKLTSFVAGITSGLKNASAEVSNSQIRKGKLSKMILCTCAVLSFHATLSHPNLDYRNNQNQPYEYLEFAANPELDAQIEEFQKNIVVSSVTEAERDAIAKMVYGEAGVGADPIEVIHVLLNRMSSPKWKGSVMDLLTAKNQFVGYSKDNPVTQDYRKMVDMAIYDWEANGKKPVCDHWYFVTHRQGISNKFEKSPNKDGSWVDFAHKQYEPEGQFCDTATRQAKTFFAERDSAKVR